jgi:hypothetical protein
MVDLLPVGLKTINQKKGCQYGTLVQTSHVSPMMADVVIVVDGIGDRDVSVASAEVLVKIVLAELADAGTVVKSSDITDKRSMYFVDELFIRI